MPYIGATLLHLNGTNKIRNILFKNLNISIFLFFLKKLVLLENNFNENIFTSQKTWKKFKIRQMATPHTT